MHLPRLNLLVTICLLVLLSACNKAVEKDENVTCQSPMILIGGECCLDNNGNSICDEFEKEQKEEQPQNTETKGIKTQNYLNLSQLEDKIQTRFISEKKYVFRDLERGGVTGIEATFDVRISTLGRFYILKIKEERNFVNSYEDFSTFISRMYNLNAKNIDIWANSEIDYRAMEDVNWENVFYEYEHDIEEINISDKKVFFEVHRVLFIKPTDNAQDALLEVKADIWCTPKLIVEVHPANYPELGWSGSTAGVKATLNGVEEDFRKGILKTSEKIIGICNNN